MLLLTLFTAFFNLFTPRGGGIGRDGVGVNVRSSGFFLEIPKNDVNVRFSGFYSIQKNDVNVRFSGFENFDYFDSQTA